MISGAAGSVYLLKKGRLFYRGAVWGASLGLFPTHFHPHVAQDCILNVR